MQGTQSSAGRGGKRGPRGESETSVGRSSLRHTIEKPGPSPPRAAQEEAEPVRALPGRWGLGMQFAACGEGTSWRRDGGLRGGRSVSRPGLLPEPRPPRPPSSLGTHWGPALGAAGRRVRTEAEASPGPCARVYGFRWRPPRRAAWPQAARAADGWGVGLPIGGTAALPQGVRSVVLRDAWSRDRRVSALAAELGPSLKLQRWCEEQNGLLSWGSEERALSPDPVEVSLVGAPSPADSRLTLTSPQMGEQTTPKHKVPDEIPIKRDHRTNTRTPFPSSKEEQRPKAEERKPPCRKKGNLASCMESKHCCTRDTCCTVFPTGFPRGLPSTRSVLNPVELHEARILGLLLPVSVTGCVLSCRMLISVLSYNKHFLTHSLCSADLPPVWGYSHDSPGLPGIECWCHLPAQGWPRDCRARDQL
ncbi:hypothetical protein MC885_000716, partial [Smutsia gigantea]